MIKKHSAAAKKPAKKAVKHLKKGSAHSASKLKKVTHAKRAIATGLSKPRKKSTKVAKKASK